uniref:Uncharacterized protein n=1 Tax=Steinernema glaseri TaxID=37863 RepID=A0A1I8AFU2_9BILA
MYSRRSDFVSTLGFGNPPRGYGVRSSQLMTQVPFNPQLATPPYGAHCGRPPPAASSCGSRAPTRVNDGDKGCEEIRGRAQMASRGVAPLVGNLCVRSRTLGTCEDEVAPPALGDRTRSTVGKP